MGSAKENLAEFVIAGALKRGDFILANGQNSDTYVDLRKLSLDHRVAPLIGDVMLEVVGEFDPVDAVGGLTMGADPIAASIMHRGLLVGKNYDSVVVRKMPKAHGLERLIEGPDVSGKRIVIVEDTSTTGASPLAAARAIEEAGGEVVGVCVVVDRDTGAANEVEKAGFPYRAALNLRDLQVR